MKVRIKKLNDKAVIPSYAKAGDAGMDLTATEVNADDLDGVITYSTLRSYTTESLYVCMSTRKARYSLSSL